MCPNEIVTMHCKRCPKQRSDRHDLQLTCSETRTAVTAPLQPPSARGIKLLQTKLHEHHHQLLCCLCCILKSMESA